MFLGFQTGCRAVEKIGTHVGLKLQGSTEAMVANQSAEDCINELGIIYFSSYAISPEKRIMGFFVWIFIVFTRKIHWIAK